MITSNLHQPSLEDFCDWLKGQADSYDDCFKFPFRGRYEGAGERHNTFFGKKLETVWSEWVYTKTQYIFLHSSRNVTPDGNNELKQQRQLTKQHQKQLPHPPNILVHLIKVVVTLFYYKLCLLLCMGQRDTSTHMQC